MFLISKLFIFLKILSKINVFTANVYASHFRIKFEGDPDIVETEYVK